MNRTMCKAQTVSGECCKAQATSDGFCSIHSDPQRATELGRKSGVSRRRGKSIPNALLPPPRTGDDLKRALGEIFSEVRAGQMDISVGKALSYIASVLVKTIELSDHEIRLRAMEQLLKSLNSNGAKE